TTKNRNLTTKNTKSTKIFKIKSSCSSCSSWFKNLLRFYRNEVIIACGLIAIDTLNLAIELLAAAHYLFSARFQDIFRALPSRIRSRLRLLRLYWGRSYRRGL